MAESREQEEVALNNMGFVCFNHNWSANKKPTFLNICCNIFGIKFISIFSTQLAVCSPYIYKTEKNLRDFNILIELVGVSTILFVTKGIKSCSNM